VGLKPNLDDQLAFFFNALTLLLGHHGASCSQKIDCEDCLLNNVILGVLVMHMCTSVTVVDTYFSSTD